MQESVRLLRIPFLKGEPTPVQRMNVCMHLSNFTDIDYARELEQLIFKQSKKQCYRVNSTEFVQTIENHGETLFVYHSPLELLNIITEELSNPERKPEYVQMMKQEKHFESLLEEGVRHVEKLQKWDNLLKCRRCKSNDIITEQKQTRAADEGMSVFAVCRNCLTKWKMG